MTEEKKVVMLMGHLKIYKAYAQGIGIGRRTIAEDITLHWRAFKEDCAVISLWFDFSELGNSMDD
jgi:hypothetical protein